MLVACAVFAALGVWAVAYLFGAFDGDSSPYNHDDEDLWLADTSYEVDEDSVE
jgi:hypothetical protein